MSWLSNKCDDIFSRLDTIHERDVRTRQTDKWLVPRLHIALCGKTRMLATVNRSCTTRVTKFFGQVDPVKIFISCSLIIMQTMVAVYNTVLEYAGDSKNLWCCRPASLGVSSMPDSPEISASSTCYCTKFGSSMPNSMSLCMKIC